MTGNDKDNRLQGRLVVLTGGTGYFGRHLAQGLLTRGARLRGRCDVTRPESLARAFAGADAVVNLVGAFAGNLDAVQGAGAGAIAAAAHSAGAKAFVHISAIGANAASSIAYARTKAEGEAAILTAFANATILRPSILFGPDDAFLNMFGALVASLPILPVFGPQARIQPLFVDDAARAVCAALAEPATHGGKTYEIAGPEVITMLELNQRIAQAAGRTPTILPLPDAVLGAIAALTGWLPGAPITSDQWHLLKAGNVASGALPGLAELGVGPRPLALFLDRWMAQYRAHGRFGDAAKV